MTTNYLGVIDGFRTWEVLNDSGERVGLNQVADEVPTVPASVTARQIRLWLVKNGISLQAVDSAIAAIPDSQIRDLVRVEWEYAPYVERNHPMLVPLAAALGLDAQQVDVAFQEAAVL